MSPKTTEEYKIITDLFHKAEKLISSKEISNALEIYECVIRNYPDSYHVIYAKKQIKKLQNEIKDLKPVKIKCPYCEQWFLKLTEEQYKYSLEGNIARGLIFLPWGVVKAIKNKPYIECPHCNMKIMQG